MFKNLSRVYDSYRSRDSFWIAVLFAVSAIVMLAIPLFGIPEGYDVPQHLRFAATFRDALAGGQLVPSWAGVDNYGFGSIGTRFYPPVADYLLAVTHSLTDDWYSAFSITSFFWMFAGCVGIYLWIREFQTREIAAAGAVVYAIIPYRLLEIYQFVLFSEFAASAVLPFCFFAASRVMRKGRARDVIVLSVAYSILILTHIPTTLIGSAALAIYCLLMIDWKSAVRPIVKLCAAVVASVAATAFYWIRLVTEVDWVKHNTAQYSTGFYDYRRHFFPIYFSFGEFYWQRLLWLLDIAIVLTLVMLLPTCIALCSRRFRQTLSSSQYKLLIALTGTAVAMLLMASTPGSLIWSVLPTLEKVQFPWRFLSAGSLVISFSFALSISCLSSRFPAFKRVIGYSATAMVLVVLLYDITQTILPAAPVPPEKFAEKLADMRNEEGCSCWWPIWANENAFANKELVSATERTIDSIVWGREQRSFRASPGAPVGARIATFWYPYWSAEVNGVRVQVERDENGAILIPLPADASNVRLYFEEPVGVEVGKAISFGSWLILLISIPFSLRSRRIVSTKRQPVLVSS